ncbi:MAG: T9SS type A sorting domain-containing protein, partial [Candidatus Latescibacteria bacterium]|nr:T9SS type A sorting domain-containing protein [Candidatus Latescibacterota bacterium]
GFNTTYDFDYHLFRFSISDNSAGSAIATIEVLDEYGNPVGSPQQITPQDFAASNRYQEFEYPYAINSTRQFRYRVTYNGNGMGRELRLNKISAADERARTLLRSLNLPPALQSGFSRFDDHLQKVLNDHAAFPALWRLYGADEPTFYRLETTGYIENYFRTSATNPRRAISGIGNQELGVLGSRSAHEFTRWTDPDTLLVDGYPIGDNPEPFAMALYTYPMVLPGQTDYNNALQERWDKHLIPILSSARDSSKTSVPAIPFSYIAQVHNHGTNLREPTPQEIRAMVYMALTYGAKGIYYYLYLTIPSEISTGLASNISPYTTNAKWSEVQSLNGVLDSLDTTLLQLTSTDVFPSSAAPRSFVQGLSDASDFQIGTFSRGADSYLMIVNRRCAPGDTRTVNITLDADSFSGTAKGQGIYFLTDAYSKAQQIRSTDINGQFVLRNITLAPGEGRLFHIEQRNTWTGTVTLTGDLSVPVGVTLNIAPWTTVKCTGNSDDQGSGFFNTKTELFVYGTLSAGSVIFQSQEGGSATWGGIYMVGNGASPSQTSSDLVYSSISNADYGTLVYESRWGQTKFRGCTYSNCVYAIYYYNSGAPYIASDNRTSHQTISGSTWGITTYGTTNDTISNSLITGSQYQGFWVGGASNQIHLENNTIDANAGNGAAGVLLNGNSSIRAKNIIARGHAYGGMQSDGTGSAVIDRYVSYNNDVYGYEFSGMGTSASSRKALFSDPRFNTGAYTLSNTSPALDLDSTQTDSIGGRRDLGRYGGTYQAGTASGVTKLEDYYVNGGTDGWASVSGSWGNNGQGDYKVTGIDGASRSWKAANATSYAIETRMRFSSGGQQGKVIYANADQNEDLRLDLIYDYGPSYVRLQTPTGTTTLAPPYCPAITPNTWYKVRVEVVAGSPYVVNTYVNGVLCHQNVSLGSLIPNGKVGVGSYGPTHDAEFDYVLVLNGVGTPPNNPLLEGLVSYWPLDSNANDAEGTNPNHGTVYGATLQGSGRIGGCYYFDGYDDRIAIPINGFPTGGGARTTAAWMKTGAGGLHEIISYGATGGGQAWTMGQWDQNVFVSSWASPQYTVSAPGLNNNAWKHVVVTLESGTAKTYVDGSLIDSRGMGINTGTSAGGQIGARISPTEYFSGYIDEVGVWSRALSSSEVSQLYNSGSGLNPLAKPIADQVVAQEQEVERLPLATRLAGNYPNPFNPETIIHYEMASAERVKLEIYDLLGQKVSVLVDGVQFPGRYQAVWDGRDTQGRVVASGVYIYRLATPSHVESRKMTLLR